MIHTKSLIRRLNCVPWLLAACLAVVWAGDAQAQAGRLVVKSTDGETVRLDLDVLEVNEGALDNDDAASHKNAAFVPIVVTATRIDSDGEDVKDDDALKLLRINLGSAIGSGDPSEVEDRLVLGFPTDPDVSPASRGRFSISMPILVIDAKKAKGMATISFVPHQDILRGNDAFDEGRGTSADDGLNAQATQAAIDVAQAAADKHAALTATPAPTDIAAATETADEAAIAAARVAAQAAIEAARAAGVTGASVEDLAADVATDTRLLRAQAAGTAIDNVSGDLTTFAATNTVDNRITVLVAQADVIATAAEAIVTVTTIGAANDVLQPAINAANAAQDIADAFDNVAAATTDIAAIGATGTEAEIAAAVAAVAAAIEAVADAPDTVARFDPDEDDDLRIWITGDITGEGEVRPAYFILRDDDRENQAITLSFSHKKLSKEAGNTTVTVTATLDAKNPGAEDLKVDLDDVRLGLPGPPTTPDADAEGIATLKKGDVIAPRDTYYKTPVFGEITIGKAKLTGSVDVEIDPQDEILPGGEKGRDAPHELKGQSWIAVGSDDSSIPVIPGFIELTADDVPNLRTNDEGVGTALELLSPTPRDDGGDEQEVKVKISLNQKATAPTPVRVRVEQIKDKGDRGPDYRVDIEESSLDIAVGETSTIATLFVTPRNLGDDGLGDDGKDDWVFDVVVSLAGIDATDVQRLPVTIIDGDSDLSKIELRASVDGGDPNIQGDAGDTEVTITAYVIGAAHSAAINIPLIVVSGDGEGTAVRNIDYKASGFRTLTIEKGMSTGTQTLTITPIPVDVSDTATGDIGTEDKPETVVVGSATRNADGKDGHAAIGDGFKPVEPATINLIDAETPEPPKTDPVPDPDPLSFSDEAKAAADEPITGKVDVELPAVELPVAVPAPAPADDADEADEDGEAPGPVLYALGELPAGLNFNPSTRMLSGTPEAAAEGTAQVRYVASDGTNSAELTYTITIDPADPPPPPEPEPDPPALSFAKDAEPISGVVGTALSVELPAAMPPADDDAEADGGEDGEEDGGEDGEEDGEEVTLTYLLSGDLPAGLEFFPETRTISGTPEAATEGAEVQYYATDGTNAATQTYTITIAAEPPPVFTVASVEVDADLIRENASHGTAITVTVKLEAAAEVDTKVTLDFAGPRENATATRDQEFTAAWDADLGRVISIAKGSSSGTAKVTVTPIQNTKVGDAAFTVQATSASGSQGKSEDIVIADDDSASEIIILSVAPDTITETDGEVSVTVTATLSGGGLEDDTTVTVGIDVSETGSTATRDRDYNANFPVSSTTIAIAAGALSGETSLTITPIPDVGEAVCGGG